MAMINGESFEPGRRPNGTVRPATPNVTVTSQHNRILPYAFHGNASLQTIHIPASVNTIGDFAFIGASGLRTISNFRTAPQQINATTFAGLNRANINVIIPSGTTQAYRAAGWVTFRLIEIDEIDISARVTDLVFNGTSFTYNMIEIAGNNALTGVALHVEVKKHSGSNITTEPIRQVVIGQSGVGEYTPIPTSISDFVSGEYIEILVYADNLGQHLLARQLIHPVVFTF
jgi:hypothetical protein